MSTPSYGHHDPSDFHVYDTTMRDGAQQEGLNLSVQDKLHIAKHLDDLGVGYIEGGWPGSNPKDTEFFALAAKELEFQHATLAAFGSTRRPNVAAADDPLVAALRELERIGVTGAGKGTLARMFDTDRLGRQDLCQHRRR